MKPAGSGLTFHWPDERAVSFILPGFIALSFFAHAVSFYIFQITYPPSAHIVPPPAQVSLLAAGSPANDALLRWIEAEDPALITKTSEVTPAHILDVPYVPSFAEVRTQPQITADPTPSLAYPAALSPSALIASAVAEPAALETDTGPRPTLIHYSSSLAHRPITQSPLIAFHTSLTELHPTRFMIGVTDRGEVRYLFLQSSSGDKSIDEQAEAHLRQTEFAHADEPLVWGMAIFSWGADAFQKSAARP